MEHHATDCNAENGQDELPSELAAEGGSVEADLPSDGSASALPHVSSGKQSLKPLVSLQEHNIKVQDAQTIIHQDYSEGETNQLDVSTLDYDQQHVVPYMEVNSDLDGGYSSHSTCSSCPVDNQPMEQNECGGHPNTDAELFEYELDGCHDHSELNDILYHFDQFFRGQVEQAINQFQDRMHAILDEQQVHVRQITAKALKQSQNQADNVGNLGHVQPPFKISRISAELWESISPYISGKLSSERQSTNSLPSTHTDSDSSGNGGHESEVAPIEEDLSNEPNGIEKNKKLTRESEDADRKQKLLVQLLTLTNNVSAMLLKPEYRPGI